MANHQSKGNITVIPPEKRGKGRPKGTPNLIPKTLKEMILTALRNAGGDEYLLMMAYANPAAFLQLVGKVLPLQVVGDAENPVQVTQITRIIVDPKSAPITVAVKPIKK